MRVLEVGGGLDLGEEALGTDDGGEFGAEDLDGDGAVVLEVVGEVDRGHAALAQLPLDAVAVGEWQRRGGRRVSATYFVSIFALSSVNQFST